MDQPIPTNFISVEMVPTKKGHIKVWIIVAAFVVTVCIGVSYVLCRFVTTFSRSAHLSVPQMYETVSSGLGQNFFTNRQNLNVVFFGLDQVGNSRENSLLTDTIMVLSITSTGKIVIVPLPRDLWIDPLKTKINALYYYGENNPELGGVKLAAKTISEITALPIDHTVVLDLDTVKHVIDTLGGVEVTVDEAFTDSSFPRDDVAPDILPIESRYKTVSFTSGQQHMDGTKALEFIRSRKSENSNENTDESRSVRQQKVIMALVAKLIDKKTLTHPYIYGQLYSLWKAEVKSSLSDANLVTLAKYYVLQKPTIFTLQIPIKTATSSGIIFNPPIKKYRQWVWEPVDPTWGEFAQFFRATLQP